MLLGTYGAELCSSPQPESGETGKVQRQDTVVTYFLQRGPTSRSFKSAKAVSPARDQEFNTLACGGTFHTQQQQPRSWAPHLVPAAAVLCRALSPGPGAEKTVSHGQKASCSEVVSVFVCLCMATHSDCLSPDITGRTRAPGFLFSSFISLCCVSGHRPH